MAAPQNKRAMQKLICQNVRATFVFTGVWILIIFSPFSEQKKWTEPLGGFGLSAVIQRRKRQPFAAFTSKMREWRRET
jgi:hypothetical protein